MYTSIEKIPDNFKKDYKIEIRGKETCRKVTDEVKGSDHRGHQEDGRQDVKVNDEG